jgi:hypothetical protein
VNASAEESTASPVEILQPYCNPALLQAKTFELRAERGECQHYLKSAGQFERYWRLHSAGVWARALNGDVAMRDYEDCLGPYLISPIDGKDWGLFRARDVNGEAMPVGHLRSAVEFHQFAAKITPRNPMGIEHGVHV